MAHLHDELHGNFTVTDNGFRLYFDFISEGSSWREEVYMAISAVRGATFTDEDYTNISELSAERIEELLSGW